MGRPRTIPEKPCPVCGRPFRTRSASCSYTCGAVLRRGKTHRYPRRASQARQMSPVEVAWLAGLFDGEGSIVLVNRNRSGGGSVRISVYNTVKPLLDRVREVTGCGSMATRHTKDKVHHTQAWYWYVGGESARDLLAQMRPWLIVKAERADAVAAGESFPRQKRWDFCELPSGPKRRTP